MSQRYSHIEQLTHAEILEATNEWYFHLFFNVYIVAIYFCYFSFDRSLCWLCLCYCFVFFIALHLYSYSFVVYSNRGYGNYSTNLIFFFFWFKHFYIQLEAYMSCTIGIFMSTFVCGVLESFDECLIFATIMTHKHIILSNRLYF